MRTLSIIFGGFLAGSAMIVALAIATSQTTTVSTAKASHLALSTNRTMGSAPMTSSASGTGMTMGSVSQVSSPQARTLTIQHVLHGCHVWSEGGMTGPSMRMHLHVGQKLMIRDMDVDAHRMLEFSGPMHMHLGRPMMGGRGMTLVFPKKGTYRLGTRTVEMPGGGMDVKTIGPDNHLRLVVTVA